MNYSILRTGFSKRIFGFVVLLVLGAGLVAAPSRVKAQEAAATAQTAAAPNTTNEAAAKTEAAKPAEDDMNVYRHTALVQSLAKLMHLPVETTARLFEFINFAILALAVLIPLVKFVPKVLRKRSQTLKHDLETARKVTQDASTRLSAIEEKLSGLDKEIAAIRAQVEEEGKNDEARIKASIEEESVRIVAAAEQEIESAAAHAKRGLRHFAADLAIEQAAKQLVLTPETDRALIAEFVIDAGKRGQN